MFGRRYITPMVFICLCILIQTSFASKSVYVISSQDDSVVKPYLIDANDVTLQATADLLQEGAGAIALATWPQKNLIFATYDSSPMITWASTNALVNLGEYNTGVTGYYGLGGIR